MLSTKNIISFAAILCGLLIVFAAPEKSSAQFIPPGSYQKSCKNIKTDGATLKAYCNGGSGKLGFPDMNGDSELANYFECEGSIWNDDAKLKCDRNTNSALIQKAKAALNANYSSVTGLDFSQDYATFRNYLHSMFKDGLAAQFYEGKLGGVFNGGGASYDWFVKYFNQPEMTEIKRQIITRAFYDVYGSGQIQPAEFAQYNSMQVAYIKIVVAEMDKMNAPLGVARRTLMIIEAYKKSFGRSPVKAEYDYWTPKKEKFKDLVEANRAYLYSPNGAKELSEMVQRVLIAKGNKNPIPNQINEAISKYSAMKPKPVYGEIY